MAESLSCGEGLIEFRSPDPRQDVEDPEVGGCANG